MAKNIVVVLNYPGVRELMQSPEMQAVVSDAAAKVADRAQGLSGGLAFETDTGIGQKRAWAVVKPGSVHAYKKARKENIMEKAKRGVKV